MITELIRFEPKICICMIFKEKGVGVYSPPPPATGISSPPLLSEPIFGKGMQRSTFKWKKKVFQWKGGRQFSEWGVW